MSSNESSFLKNTADLIETDPEIKSFVYQQINEFNPYVTPETLVMVIARDPAGHYQKAEGDITTEDHLFDENSDIEDYEEEVSDELKKYKYRIAIILKEDEHSIESEAFSNDIFDAIKAAKEILITRLLEIQEEVESPQDRLKAIQEASDNKTVH